MAEKLSDYLRELKSENTALVNLLLQAKSAAGIHDDERAVELISEIVPGFDKKMLLDIEDRRELISFEVAQAMIKVYEPDAKLYNQILTSDAFRRLREEFENKPKDDVPADTINVAQNKELVTDTIPSPESKVGIAISENAKKDIADYAELITTTSPSIDTIQLVKKRLAQNVIRREKIPVELIEPTLKALYKEFEKALKPLMEERAKITDDSLGANMKSLRVSCRFSLSQMAKKLNLSNKSKYTRYESGDRTPTAEIFAQFLNEVKEALTPIFLDAIKEKWLRNKTLSHFRKDEENDKYLIAELQRNLNIYFYKAHEAAASELDYEELIIKFRIKAKFSIKHMNEVVGLAKSNDYTNYENGITLPKTKTAAIISNELKHVMTDEDLEFLKEQWIEKKIAIEKRQLSNGMPRKTDIQERKLELSKKYDDELASLPATNHEKPNAPDTAQHLGLATKRLSEENRTGRTRQ